MHCNYSSPRVCNNTFTGNVTLYEGGGILSMYGSPLIACNAVIGNYAANGGGIYCFSGSSVVASNVIAGNSVQYSGGGLYLDGSPACCVANNTIVNNAAPQAGGGIDTFLTVGATATITNNIIANNSSGINGGGGTVALSSNCVYNPLGANYAGISQGLTDISVDPKLLTPQSGDFHLSAGSPCIDVGSAVTLPPEVLDLDGEQRIQGSRIDIGADEYDGIPPTYLQQPVVRVSPQGSDANDGSSWSLAKRTIQASVDAVYAVGGGEVWLSAGSYNERITLRSYVRVYGGFCGSETSLSQRDWHANQSVVDGSGSTNGNVVTASQLGLGTSILDGVTLTKAGTNYSAVYCNYAGPQVSNCLITGNSGTGITSANSSMPLILNDTIRDNSSAGVSAGGGIVCGNIVSRNRLTGISAYGARVYNNIVMANGGGVFCAAGSDVANNTVIGNYNPTNCGGIYCDGSTTPSCTISNNVVAFNSSGVYLYSTNAPTLRNNCVYNPSGLNYSGLTAGTGDISVDPRLLSTDFGQALLTAGSPCIDAGWDAAVQPGWSDMDGEARVQGTHVDIGADEYDGVAPPPYTPAVVRVSTSGSDVNDGTSWASAKKTVQAGIDAAYARGGAEVWIAGGTYIGSLNMKGFVCLYGGFAGTESDRFQRDWKARQTVIDGGGGTSVIKADSLGHLTSGLDGLTVCNCKSGGAGIYCTNTSIKILDCSIVRNPGTGVYCNQSASLIANNNISGNWGYSGIACNSGSSPWIINNTITENSSTTGGGGISLNSSMALICNNVVAFNSSGIYSTGTGTPTLYNNCVYNPDGYNYSGVTAGTADISTDPKLDAEQYGQTHLTSFSPCIDAGADSAVQVGWTDVDGEARLQGSHVDMGADEFNGVAPPAFEPGVIRVSPSGDDGNDGSSWASAKKTIQAAIDAASARGSDVWVAAGTYVGCLNLSSYVYLYGGFAGIETSRAARTAGAAVTIIDANFAGSAIAVRAGNRTSCIDGFTIRNGVSFGGGVYCSATSPTISNNVLIANLSYSTGGGICFGSGVGSAAVIGNTIVGNYAGGGGGGVYISSGSVRLANNIIAFNSSGIYKGSSAQVTLANNCVYNPAACNYSGLAAGTADLQVDPGLVSPTYGRLHLRSDSPCIDAGSDVSSQEGSVDMDGQPRAMGSRVDIGADEYDGSSPAPFQPALLRVTPGGDDGNDGSDWVHSKRTVQAAIDSAAMVGGDVWVANGVYSERVVLKPYVFLHGGFSGSETDLSQRSLPLNRTALDGRLGGSVITAANLPYNTSCVDGLTLRNGKATNGGGLYCSNAYVSLSNCTLSGNVATSAGGGCYLNGAGTLSGCVLTGNSAGTSGGGIYGGGCMILDSCTVNGNSAASGGGIYSSTSYGSITRSSITGNNATGSGGGIYAYGNISAVWSSNIIAGNSAATGGGIRLDYGGAPLVGNTIVGNTGTNGGGVYCYCSVAQMADNIFCLNSSGIYIYPTYPPASQQLPVLINNCVYNPAGANYTNISAGTADISADPLFVNQASGDYHLSPLSPCVNAGLNSAFGLPATDIDGEPRIMGRTVDIGADEASCVATISGTRQVPSNTQVGITGAAVTAAFPDYFYIESDNRSSGIRVEKVAHGIDAGQRADIAGTAVINSSGERCIAATSASGYGSADVVPLAMGNGVIGGGKNGFQDAVWGRQSSGVWQPLSGLSNIGLLIRTCGSVTPVDATTFIIDDGNGENIECVLPTGVSFDPSWAYVIVTGVCSCKKNGTRLIPRILIRTRSDVQSL